ncbi:MAG: metal-dependent hydrolase [Betaproteobacteria bacterium]|nr:metal-dependent hydrolase [Betaproteobacteria bacterium]
MDTLTHALSGALLARATASRDAPPRSIPRRVAAGFFACAAPDLDFVVALFGPVEYLLHHRSVTHSLVMMPLWALPLAWLLAKVLREPGGWRALYGVCVLAIGTHIAGDWITSYGTMLLAPFSDWRAALGTTFIIDLWFSGLILAGLAGSAILFRSRIPSLVAIAALAGYVGFQYLQKEKALEFGREYARVHGLAGAVVSVHPRPVSPYNWTVFVGDSEAQRFAHVNLARDTVREYKPGDGFVAKLDAAYRPIPLADWRTRRRYGDSPAAQALARSAWESPALRFFRWFAEQPAFDGLSEGSTCVWFLDLRFLNPGRDWVPFRFGACRDRPGSPWRAYERDTEGGRTPVD